MEVWGVRLVSTRDPYAMRLVSPFAGHWLASYDPDAKAGLGEAVFTDDPAQAITFPSFDAAKAYWMGQSTEMPTVSNGQGFGGAFGMRNGVAPAGEVENRPLAMATNVAIDPMPETV